LDVGASEDEDEEGGELNLDGQNMMIKTTDCGALGTSKDFEEIKKDGGQITELGMNTSVDDTRMIVDSTALPSDNGIVA
jgi:hypothetical protein